MVRRLLVREPHYVVTAFVHLRLVIRRHVLMLFFLRAQSTANA